MKLKQVSVFVENKPGAVCAPCKVLADAGIDMRTLTLADTKDFGILRIISKDWEKAQKVLKDAKFAVSVNEVIALQVEDVPGGLYKVLQALSKHDLNVEYLYATVAGCDNKPVLVFRFDDTEGAVEKLKNCPECGMVGAERFFKN